MTQTIFILFFTTMLVILLVLKPNLNASLQVWQEQATNVKSHNSVATNKIASIMQTGLESNSFNCQNRYRLILVGHIHPAKLKSISS